MYRFKFFGLIIFFFMTAINSTDAQEVADDENLANQSFMQAYNDLAQTIQWELEKADALDLLIENKDGIPLTFNMLRKKDVFTEEIVIKAGDAMKHYISITARMNTEDKIAWLRNHNDLKIHAKSLSELNELQLKQLKTSLNLEHFPLNPGDTGKSRCEAITEYKDNALAIEIVKSIENMDIDKVTQREDFGVAFLNYLTQKIGLQAYANACQ